MRISPLALALSIASLAPAAASAESPPAAPIPLGAGESSFWLGGQIESGDLPDASLCDIAAPCPTFKLQVRAGGQRLRVAYDTPSRENSFELDLIAPDGTFTSEQGSNVFDAEAFVDKPAAGTWTVRIVPQGVDHAFFRLRAKLEDGPASVPAGHVPLLPNLRAVPPMEIGFVAPANPLNAAYPPDTVNPPLSVAGQEPVSCTADESAPVDAGGGGAGDCLRFTSGPINAGAGPFMKTFKFASDMAAGGMTPDGAFIRGPAFQDVLYSDGKVETRRAGTYSFHTTHAHFHDDGILTYELFRVAGDQLLPAGKGTKSGFCPADQLMGEWRSFTQEKAGFFGEGDTPTGSCYGAADDGLLSLTRGWGDVYRWQRPGQYVDFSGNGDGYYVVRTTVDKGDTTLETDETDNSAYAYVKITGRHVELIERGWGLSELDPKKTVFTGFGPASQDPFGAAPAAAAEPAATTTARDRSAPRVRSVRLRGSALAFVLSEPARVRVTVLRGNKVLRRLTVTGDAGANQLALRLRRGRYRVVLAATDNAGNAASPVSVRIRR
jgi:hypothetical protein